MSDSGKGGVYRLTPEEIEELRAEMKASGQWMKRQLEIDPELRHLDDERIRQAQTLEGDNLAEPAKDQGRRVPTSDELEQMIMEAGDAAVRKTKGKAKMTDDLPPADDPEGASDTPSGPQGR